MQFDGTVAALEDKIVQRAVVALLNAIYEEDFLGFSYGFRPGRGAHDALDALCVGIHGKKVSFIVDADIRSFFDAISQQWLIRFLEHRIGDRRIIRLIQKWLKAGILEDGVVAVSDRGTGQGSVISPLLANIYLHYALDLWAARWRRRTAAGDMIIVRYADDFIIGFQHESEAQRFLKEMRERLREFALSLHPEKTRLIEFGRFAAERRKRRGLGKPETFNFLGFTFICNKTRAGKFQIQRKTRADRMRAKLQEIKQEMRRRMHQPIPEQGRWLERVVRGYFNYHAVPTNGQALEVFRHHVTDLWRRTLLRRSQKDRVTWARMTQLVDDWLPKPTTLHPWPSEFGRFAAAAPQAARARQAGDLQLPGLHLHLQQDSCREDSRSNGKPAPTACGRSCRRSSRRCDGACTSQSPSRGGGWSGLSAATSTITPCQPMVRHWRCSGIMSLIFGGARCCVAVRRIG